jgi:hypothetical protein
MGVISLHSDLPARQAATFVPSLLQYDGGLIEGEGQDAGESTSLYADSFHQSLTHSNSK